ncbi:MAG: ribosome assembly RNA-binding protein YhbY [Gemmatimonadaceae bacterium]|nr:ribosome assembly RNA-binding protein YhbY [Gemmatimonadaceae bacterium]NUQ91576.1 ribosome assembly RNA-binding protein YhbY [Gemmatimonadaceae bacterium]NUR20638.1 ribosome assembly RNA-binding protein YhbY [Gemmatimonadaceae bacterium]NUS96052.1 ribosome assembly RNA-binding protein YhbY [Gemmatimonadaceae bacterium]
MADQERQPKITSKERATLRGEAHHLDALVHVGKEGITDPLLATLDDALRTHELVKIQLTKNAAVDARDAARQLADAMDADVVQVIGRTTTLYRHNPELERRKGDLPPWRS